MNNFDTTQSAHVALRDIVTQRTKRFIAWTGSGISASVGLPTWPRLRDRLTSIAEATVDSLDSSGRDLQTPILARARRESDPWLAFELLQDLIGNTSFVAEIRGLVRPPDSIPPIYERLWRLQFSGCLTLNLDRLATRSYATYYKGSIPAEFVGQHAGQYLHILQSADPFIANLHGTYDNADTWIFTRTQLADLYANEPYVRFLETCIASRVVVFIGISADDIAAGGHLDRLTKSGVSLGDHFWITHRNDYRTKQWAERAGLRIINYSADDGDEAHAQISQLFDDIEKYTPEDSDADIVKPSLAVSKRTVDYLPPVGEIIRLPSANIRNLLNYEANRILSLKGKDIAANYQSFLNEYKPAIHRAWYLSIEEPDNDLLGFKLLDRGARGGFGRIYAAQGRDGAKLAVKVLHQEVMENADMLASFRRGVRAMQILSDRNVHGMVPYIEAYEIPACAIMDYVEGPNIREAVETRAIQSWDDVLTFGIQLSEIIKSAHALPEQVLHRDIRPTNIMLRDYYITNEIDVVVLDFDLSWHRDAIGTSIENPNSQSGFVAPEQVDRSLKASTRNALIDSYGLGMTLYYVRTGREPVFAQPKHDDWHTHLSRLDNEYACTSWNSAPRRFSRIIENATHYNQNQRWDMTQIYGELQRIYTAIQRPNSVTSAELLAEELASRVDISATYQWCMETHTATFVTPAGQSIALRGDESSREVIVKAGAVNTNMDLRKNIVKYAQKALDQSTSLLKSTGWNITKRHGSASGHELGAVISADALSRSLSEASNVISRVYNHLSFH